MNTTQPTLPGLKVRLDVVAALREVKDLTDDGSLAAAMGVDRSSVSRVMSGKQRPGPRFIAGLCIALNAKFENLFEIVKAAA